MFFPHEAVLFPSRGSTFSLARQCFGAFTDAPIGGGVCKNFYTFSVAFRLFFRLIICICFAFCLASKRWAKCGKLRGWSQKGVDLGAKMPQKREKPFFVLVQIMSKKVCETGVLGEEMGKTDAEKAFFVQVERMLHNANIQCITQK